uniref:Amyloid-like protein 1 n=1 Tax=Sinocyclocheilus rhinocerous TaxID=307959 RepID=A0A673K596_9TELE
MLYFLLTVRPVITTLLTLLPSLLALAMTEVNGPVSPHVADPQIAMFCGRQLLHMNTESGQWEPDPQGRQGCFTQPSKILSYCQEMYPGLQISHVEEASSPATIPGWCKKGWGHCQTRSFIVVPYRCLVGEYVSEALLVPDRCRFLHQEQMDSCESYVYWHNIAKEACTADSLELHSYGMLLPCGDRFRGVEYVCCPGRAGSSGRGETETTDTVQGETTPFVSMAGEKVEDDMEEEEEEVVEEEAEEEEEEEEEEGNDKEAAEVEEAEEEEATMKVKDQEEYEYPIDSHFQGQDYMDNFYDDKNLQAAKASTQPQTRMDNLPTPRPTDGVDVYFEMPGDDSEHANFLRAKLDLEERRMKRINEIMKEWAEADNQSKNLPKSDRQALNEHFQSVLQTLEEQVAGERQRLVETHLARVVSTLNNSRRLALESYLSAVQSDPPQPDRVLQALKRYMAAEQKDRRHTLRHYQHIESADPQKAEQMKFQVYTHLHVIEERMNQSLALLYKVPGLAEKLHDEIRKMCFCDSLVASKSNSSQNHSLNLSVSAEELVRTERGDISELMTTSFSETRTTEELLPAESEEERDDEEEEDRAFQNRPYPPRIGTITTYKAHQPDVLETFNRGAMVGLLVVAVAIAMVMVISLLLVRRKPYGTISHGIVEVDPMLTPEERQLNKMQNHGYENPTYKFFEQMN